MPDVTAVQYAEAVLDTDRARALRVVQEALARGVSPEDIVFHIVVPAVDLMVRAVSERADVNLAQHFMAAQIAGEVIDAMLPRFRAQPRTLGRVVMGTSPGDFHGLGKRIVIGCLRTQQLEVTDLGLNVPAARFVDEAVARGAQVIGVSSMMVHTARGPDGALGVRRLLDERGLSGRIRLAVGGAPYRFDPGLYRAVGADAWAENGIAAAHLIAALAQEAAA